MPVHCVVLPAGSVGAEQSLKVLLLWRLLALAVAVYYWGQAAQPAVGSWWQLPAGR